MIGYLNWILFPYIFFYYRVLRCLINYFELDSFLFGFMEWKKGIRLNIKETVIYMEQYFQLFCKEGNEKE